MLRSVAVIATGLSLCFFLVQPFTAQAADATQVLTGFYGDKTWSGYASLRFEHIQKRSSIVREWVCTKGDSLCPQNSAVLDTKQLRFSEHSSILNLDMGTGLYRHLELYASVPIVLGWQSRLNHDRGVSAGNSLVSTGLTSTLFDVPHQSANRVGIGDMTVGLKWAPVHTSENSLWPTVLLGFEYLAPTGKPRSAGTANVGGGVHAFTLYSAVSQSFGRWVEPYLRVSGTVRTADPTGPFKHKVVTQTRVSPGHSMGMAIGTQIHPLANTAVGKDFRADIRLTADFTTDGREFTELFDALGTSACDPSGQCDQTLYTRTRFDETPQKTDGITDVEQYGQLGASLWLNYDALNYLSVQLGGVYKYTTPHYITFADAGKDLDGRGAVEWANSRGQNEFNPFYNRSYDEYGSRFLVESSHDFRILVTVKGQL